MMGVAAPQKPSRGGVTTLIAGLLALVVAGLAVGGSFGSVSSYRNSFEGDGDTSVYASHATWWGYGDDGSSSPIDSESLLNGLTLVLAGVLLAVGAVFAFVGARSRASGPVAGARSTISAGVGVLAGASLLELFSVLKQMEQYNDQELDAGESLEFSAGLGLWLPLGGLLLGIVATVLAHVGQRPKDVRVEPNTPRMGFPAPYGYRPQMPVPQQQQAPAVERPTDVQTEDDDASDTQRVSAETASGGVSQPAPVAAPAPVTPPAPPAPPAPTAEPDALAPVTPATTSVGDAPADRATSPSLGESATTAESSAPATPAAATQSESASETTESAVEAPAAPAGEVGKPTPLSDLPAAPPAPELSSSDERDKGGK